MLKSRSKIDVFFSRKCKYRTCNVRISAAGTVIGDPRAISRRRAAHQAICTARLVKGVESLKGSMTYVTM